MSFGAFTSTPRTRNAGGSISYARINRQLTYWDAAVDHLAVHGTRAQFDNAVNMYNYYRRQLRGARERAHLVYYGV